MNDLTKALLDIGSTYLPTEQESRFPRCKRGPNRWLEITDDDYGEKFDYRIIRRGRNTVIDPCSTAAEEWLKYHLPPDGPRWGSLGYVIESEYIAEILEHMAVNKLLSEDDYIYGQSCEDRDRHQGETGL